MSEKPYIRTAQVHIYFIFMVNQTQLIAWLLRKRSTLVWSAILATSGHLVVLWGDPPIGEVFISYDVINLRFYQVQQSFYAVIILLRALA